ncbi:MAG TPA: prolipoprotein diacylglyceryl transferase, partial [Syntrophales bacterium]|nr:prolipoprotein diacylglyceryl transferase [Syntrophales bacterium]HQK48635.1 prolipoprotein diacylglyceryl transferase [Syntrophales bacterium]
WQHLPAKISPTLFEIGSFQVRWYSLMYIVAFALTYLLIVYRLRTEKFRYTREQIQDFMVWGILGLILGGRLGYVIFYNLGYFIRHPLEIILPFSFANGVKFVGISGMSFHGGLIGIVVASGIYCYVQRVRFWDLADLLIPCVPLGYTFGRIGNFVNGELWGRATTVPWGMYFPLDPTRTLRHPSQLYEAFFEGLFLFAVLWGIRRKRPFEGAFLAYYLIGYGAVRFFIEYVREPDAHIGLYFGLITIGQILCLAMILAGAGLYLYLQSKAGR